jgi:hypothetical protein
MNEGRRIILDEDSYPREPAKIVAGPTATKKGEGYTISFALDKPDDVLVRIVNSDGATVRDIVCGVLGWNAPEPLKIDSLTQEVFWDGKDGHDTVFVADIEQHRLGQRGLAGAGRHRQQDTLFAAQHGIHRPVDRHLLVRYFADRFWYNSSCHCLGIPR